MNPSASRPCSCNCLTRLLIVALVGLPLQADAQSWIAGGSLGLAQQQDYDIGAPIANRDDTDTAYRIFGGYLIGEN